MKKIIIKLSIIVSFFVVLFLSLNFLYTSIRNLSINEEKDRYRYIAINETNYIKSCIDKVIVRTYILREMIIENDGEVKFFDKISDVIYQTVKEDVGINLRNIAIAPDCIVQKVYPLKSNESLIGFNFSDLSKKGNKEALEAYLQGKTIVTNPFDLIQGGKGIAARTPVYLKNEKENNIFWGLVTATMDFDDIIKAFNFENLSRMQVEYCLWYENDDGSKVDLTSSSTNLDKAITVDFDVYNLKWHLSLFPKNGWYNINVTWIVRSVILVISILLSLVTFMFCRIHEDGALMKKLAEEDSLTHCYSRYYLNSKILNANTGDWSDVSYNYSLAIIDIDFFKKVNDKYGHGIGDKALIQVCAVLTSSLRSKIKDVVVRFGGDEFIILCNNISLSDFQERLFYCVNTVNTISIIDAEDLKLSVSIGAAINNIENPVSYRDLLKQADENLYKVKKAGRNNLLIT